MSNALTHNPDALLFAGANDTKAAAPAIEVESTQLDTPPIGYRCVSKRWRILPDGKRDYAAYHGKTAFTFLLPVSSRLHSKR